MTLLRLQNSQRISEHIYRKFYSRFPRSQLPHEESLLSGQQAYPWAFGSDDGQLPGDHKPRLGQEF
jgi:hypothetical protein